MAIQQTLHSSPNGTGRHPVPTENMARTAHPPKTLSPRQSPVRLALPTEAVSTSDFRWVCPNGINNGQLPFPTGTAIDYSRYCFDRHGKALRPPCADGSHDFSLPASRVRSHLREGTWREQVTQGERGGGSHPTSPCLPFSQHPIANFPASHCLYANRPCGLELSDRNDPFFGTKCDKPRQFATFQRSRNDIRTRRELASHPGFHCPLSTVHYPLLPLASTPTARAARTRQTRVFSSANTQLPIPNSRLRIASRPAVLSAPMLEFSHAP